MTQPAFRVVCNGTDITEAIQKRMLMLRVHDEAGFKNDRMELTLDNCAPHVTLPTKGDKFTVYMGYVGKLRQMGVYEFDEAVAFGPPHTLTITAHAVDTNSDFKATKHRSWHGKTIGEILEKIGGEHGLSPKISEELKSKKIDHIDQVTQSNMGFLTDLARNNNAIMKVMNGTIYFAPRDQYKSLDGGSVLDCTIDFEQTTRYSYLTHGRANFSGVTARYWDRDEAKEKTSQDGSPDKGFTLPEIFTDKAAAEAAAKGTFANMQRSQETFECMMPGNPDLMAESHLVITDYPSFIPTTWLMDKVDHTMSGNGGYVTSCIGVTPSGSGGGGGSSGGEGGGGESGGAGAGGSGSEEEKRDNQEGSGSDGYNPTETDDSGGSEIV